MHTIKAVKGKGCNEGICVRGGLVGVGVCSGGTIGIEGGQGGSEEEGENGGNHVQEVGGDCRPASAASPPPLTYWLKNKQKFLWDISEIKCRSSV
jgi:hypothetical protein